MSSQIVCLIIYLLSVSSPPTANDPWGAPSAPTGAGTTSDPFGDGGTSDPWGAPSENGINRTVSVCLCCFGKCAFSLNFTICSLWFKDCPMAGLFQKRHGLVCLFAGKQIHLYNFPGSSLFAIHLMDIQIKGHFH